MANTRTSAKRARQALRKNGHNQVIKSATRSALKTALEAIKTKDTDKAKAAYHQAVRALSKAASKGAIPSRRAARKVSRLTHFVKKTLPAILPQAK